MWREIPHSATLPTKNPIWIAVGLNLGLLEICA